MEKIIHRAAKVQDSDHKDKYFVSKDPLWFVYRHCTKSKHLDIAQRDKIAKD